jgi:hypothetical protein
LADWKAVIVAAGLAATRAEAQPPPAGVPTETVSAETMAEILFALGSTAYRDLDYPRAIDLLSRAVADRLGAHERREALQMLALAHSAVGSDDAARSDLEQLLAIDPAFELGRKVSPRIRALLDEARARMSATPPPQPQAPVTRLAPAIVEMAAATRPDRPRESEPIAVRVTAPGPGWVSIFFRTPGEHGFGFTEARADTALVELIVPAPKVRTPALEFYVQADDESGQPVGRAGSAEHLFSVPVRANWKKRLTRPWLLAVVGGVILTAAAVTAVGVSVAAAHNAPAHLTIIP